MFDVGGAELIVIILAVIMLFGPKSIPKFMQQLGRGVRQFRKAQEELTQQIRDISADAAIRDALTIDTTMTAPIVVQPAAGIARGSSPEAAENNSDQSTEPDASSEQGASDVQPPSETP